MDTATPTPTATFTPSSTPTATPDFYTVSPLEDGSGAALSHTVSLGEYAAILLLLALLVSIWMMYLEMRLRRKW
ncbi:MAG: hypothetical protein L6Q98_24640 [Anaerolineae bacterium]|nr:hypothetical protein [Anaerolineae bacterium]NUQ07166.1 hypothetical protein [Anaerolineae bacterium]